MANKELAEYVLDQLDGLEDIRSIPMMGGYLFYYKERIFAGIYGSGFMVKLTETSKKYMPGSVPQAPYAGAKDMLPGGTVLEDREAFQRMVVEMFDDLPEPKKKGGKKHGL